jgi:hypothetical protein
MTRWRKSSHSSSEQEGGCVEVAALRGHVAVRDSKDPTGPHLDVLADAWHGLLTAIKCDSVEQLLDGADRHGAP